MGDAKGFMKFTRVEFGKEKPLERVKHWREFARFLPAEELKKQGARCMDCGVPFCMSGCPIGNVIPDWNDLVVNDRWEEAAAEGGLTKIYASILVDRESQRPIVVGAAGDMIKRIGTESRKDLEEMLGGRVFLDLHVKVRADWRDDERLLDEMGLRRR